MSSLKINHNTQALNTHRNLVNVDKRMKRSLEHLSSGERIVRAADGPAALMMSEQMRVQVGSVSQAIKNAETAVSAVQTTEAALMEANALLVSIRELGIHAANEGANDENMIAADQLEIDNAIDSLQRISQNATFGTRKILDGSRGVNGIAAGKGLTYLGANEKTTASPDTGYEIRITQAPSKSTMDAGDFPVGEDGRSIPGEIVLTFMENGKVAEYRTKDGDDLDVVINTVQVILDKNGLDLNVVKGEKGAMDDDGNPIVVDGKAVTNPVMRITHREYGTEAKFTVVSSVQGILSDDPVIPQVVNNGKDVQGTINGQLTYGRGTVLTAAEGTAADGLRVAYVGGVPDNPEDPIGRVTLSQQSLVFQIGPTAGQKVRVALNNVSPFSLSRNVQNESGFRNLADINVLTPQAADDTIRLIDRAVDDVNIVRGNLGAIQKNGLESQLRSLAVNREELINAESVIRDADMAEELSEFVRNQVISQSSMAMLAQTHKAPQNVLQLLRSI